MAKPIEVSRVKQSVVGGAAHPTRNFNLLRKLSWAKLYAEASKKLAAEHLVSVAPPDAAAEVVKTNQQAVSSDSKAADIAHPFRLSAKGNAFVNPALGIAVADKTDAALAQGDASRLPPHLQSGSVPLPRDYRGTILPNSSVDEALYTGVSAADALSNTWLSKNIGSSRLGPMAQTLIQYGPQAWMAARGAMDTAGVLPMFNLKQTSTIGDAPLEAQDIANKRLNTQAAWALNKDNPEVAKQLEQQADRLDAQYRELSDVIQTGDRKSDLSKGILKSELRSTIHRVATVGSDAASVMLAASKGGPDAVRGMAKTTGVVGASVAGLTMLYGADPVSATVMAAGNVAPSVAGWFAARQIAAKAGTELGGRALAAGVGRALAAPVAIASQLALTAVSGAPTDANKATFDEKLRVQAYADALEGLPPGGEHPWMRGVKGLAYAAVDPQNPLLSSVSDRGPLSDAAHAQYMEHYKEGQNVARMLNTEQSVRNELVNAWDRKMPANYIERISRDVAGLATLHKEYLANPQYRENFSNYLESVKQWASSVPVAGKSGVQAFTPAGVERIVRFTAEYGPDAFATAYGTPQSDLPPAIHSHFRNWLNNG
jgi:hypothetical protein